MLAVGLGLLYYDAFLACFLLGYLKGRLLARAQLVLAVLRYYIVKRFLFPFFLWF